MGIIFQWVGVIVVVGIAFHAGYRIGQASAWDEMTDEYGDQIGLPKG